MHMQKYYMWLFIHIYLYAENLITFVFGTWDDGFIDIFILTFMGVYIRMTYDIDVIYHTNNMYIFCELQTYLIEKRRTQILLLLLTI